MEPDGSAALHEALAAGKPVPVRPDSIADALNAPVAGEHCMAVCLERGVESVLVSEDDIRAGFRFLYERAKLAAEPGAAAGVHQLLLAGVERMALGADLHVQLRLGGTSLKFVPARAVHRCENVFGMDVRLHFHSG